VLHLAVEWDELEKLPKIKMAREGGRKRFLSDDELARLRAACAKSKNKKLSAIVAVGYNTGLRKGELLGLEWEQVDFARGMIVLDGRRTKSGKGRDVSMNEAVYACSGPAATRRSTWP
jgi:integrase